MSVIFLFIDGVGLGEEIESNPFYQFEYKGFSALTGGKNFLKSTEVVNRVDHVFKAVDATLDVEGLPQSGTGQTALFSGENAAKEINKHFGPFPHSGIKPILRNDSLFIKAQRMNKSCHFINAYPEIFFKRARKRNRWSSTTLMAKSADLPLNSVTEIKKEKALTAGILQKAWREKLSIDVPEITAEMASNRLINQLINFDLVLFEYYLTDKAGHSKDMEVANHYLKIYDRFLCHLIENKPDEATIVLCSDHGNVEDLSVKTHTLNAVPLFVYGPGARHFTHATSIMDVTPGILRVLKEQS
ncbi:alkaline phosphatase family protein [Aliifodinibius salicampi]|uniref:Alkaline phosphatase family protein n=1 Tax=Fodinibius salicampi TaxID=1920655 RepID=A0ABT3Q2F7_9BACT|nr:alkaline phosphatase family protein [Fodinibius salicampi]MCW9714285.1 alkaline phosphatase family protein [Fodinibius salicampi]